MTLAGRLDDATTAKLLGEARAFVFAAHEDFGIASVEAQAAGTPVIAFGPGGASETIRGLQSPVPTGVLFDQQTPGANNDAAGDAAIGPPAPPRDSRTDIGDLFECFQA